jgi:hypothetical protein
MNNNNNVIIIDVFNPQVIDFNIFEQRLANLFKIHKVPDEMKAAILLNKLKNESFKIVHDLVFPEDINSVEYSDLTAKLNNYYTKPTTVYGERLKFYETAMKEMESVFEWNSKLKEATSNC